MNKVGKNGSDLLKSREAEDYGIECDSGRMSRCLRTLSVNFSFQVSNSSTLSFSSQLSCDAVVFFSAGFAKRYLSEKLIESTFGIEDDDLREKHVTCMREWTTKVMQDMPRKSTLIESALKNWVWVTTSVVLPFPVISRNTRKNSKHLGFVSYSQEDCLPEGLQILDFSLNIKGKS